MPVRALALMLFVAAPAIGAGPEPLVGGPLAGLALPAFPTQHREPSGFPGCLPDPGEPGKLLNPTEGLSAQVELFPGSVEHWRANDFKYLPTRSLYDAQTLLKNWKAPQFAAATEPYAEPLYWNRRHSSAKLLDLRNAAVPVARLRVRAPTIALDCGELPQSLYVLRVIGAVETAEVIRHRKPLYLRMAVNDGPRGEESVYRFRAGYCDQFYMIGEFFFHLPEARRCKVSLWVDDGSLVEPLVHNLELHDVLAAHTRKALKTRAVNGIDPTGAVGNMTQEQRLARDEALWNSLPPLNAQLGFVYGGGKDDGAANRPNRGAGGRAQKEIEEKWGFWKPARPPLLAVNDKLKLQYSLADLAAHRPLPDPYPHKDDGCGLWTAGETPQNWFPVADSLRDSVAGRLGEMTRSIELFRQKKDADAARDAAVLLCRMAYDFPARVSADSLGFVMVQPGPYAKDWFCRQRVTMEFWHNGDALLQAYDQLFPLIRQDAALAASVGRFVPWVRAPEDVVRLIDVHLAQEHAKRLMRYHAVDANNPARLATVAALAANRELTDPWMEWVFSRTWIYPLSVSGVADLIVSGCDRDGMKYIGSFYYAQIEEASKNGELMETYVNSGGDPRYDLRDPERHPKVLAGTYWFLRSRIAGLYFPRIGDVTGPVARHGYWFEYMEAPVRRGWRWSRDPQFAWMLKHFFGRKGMTDAEWAEVEAAADRQARAPWLENRSRVLSGWMGVLESGTQYDDYRFRRALFLRVGQGHGHGHNDTLDMQFYAHGLPMTLDGGARPGYSNPPDAMSRVHNLVEVDGRNWLTHSWVTALSDVEGARYLAAQAEPPRSMPDVKLHRRQVALIDVDEGQGTRKLTPAELNPAFARLDAGVVTPNSYVFDVVRVSGGKQHTYCFHGPCKDDGYAVNLADRRPAGELDAAAQEYLKPFPKPERNFGGTAPETLVATWRYPRAPESNPSNGCEQHMAFFPWSDDQTRKYTRLQLLGQKGARVLGGYYYCKAGDYGFDNLYAQRHSDGQLESVFPAVIEPYAGEPFIASTRLLDIPGNDTDAQRAVAVEVKTRNGRTDLLFADGRPGRLRSVGGATVAGEFAYVSSDGAGLRAATLTGGGLLSAPGIALKVAQRERTGKVVRVDYAKKTMTIDAAWPSGAALKYRVFAVGVPGHMTTYTLAGVETDGRTSTLRLTAGGDAFLGRVTEVDAGTGVIVVGMGLPFTEGAPCAGVDRDWVASNEEQTKFWRADYLGGDRSENRYRFKLKGPPVADGDFGRVRAFRLWEYGVGDTVRQSTFAAVRRVGPGVYEVTGDTDVEIAVAGRAPQKVSARELAAGSVGLK
jgi:hypothetical protein